MDREPIKEIDQRVRERDQPMGLINIGNTCYSAAIFQVLYSLPTFMREISQIKVNQELCDGQDTKLESRLARSGMRTIAALQKLLPEMAFGLRKYADPSALMGSVVDDQGEMLKIGQEKDIVEFKQLVIQRIVDAIAAESKAKNPHSSMLLDPSSSSSLFSS